ncbi:diptericin-D-like [Anastrepha ludens]|uniref:diptericin-D-like n=1 Tax=Anastrepha ludens TaxID=28586 RepID=UPI0023AEE174|nr:diptericin-D-like [Anastrepha ludens]
MMFAKFLLSMCILSVALAYPYGGEQQEAQLGIWQDDALALSEPSEQFESQRFARQLNVQGGGSPGKGIDLSIDTRIPVWQSHNGRHSFDATGQYSQHLGGPYGNSRPNWGAGGMYTFRF